MADTAQLIATVTPSNATNKNVTWSSDNPAVATVSAGGLVTPKGVGTCRVKATTQDGGLTDDSSISVTAAKVPVSGVSINKSFSSMRPGNFEQLTVTVTPSDATNKNVTWGSDNPAVATVSTNGRVTSVSEGMAKITATAVDGSGKSGTCDFIIGIPVTSITINDLPSGYGRNGTFTATILPTNATVKDVLWTTDYAAHYQPIEVGINDGNYLVHEPGDYNITAFAMGGGIRVVREFHFE